MTNWVTPAAAMSPTDETGSVAMRKSCPLAAAMTRTMGIPANTVTMVACEAEARSTALRMTVTLRANEAADSKPSSGPSILASRGDVEADDKRNANSR